jgi:hypothetical protein
MWHPALAATIQATDAIAKLRPEIFCAVDIVL